MITIICVWWLGMQNQDPTWFYVLLGIAAVLKWCSAIISAAEKSNK